MSMRYRTGLLAIAALSPLPAAADDDHELAKKLQNPVASIISVPLQSNLDFRAGPDKDGFVYTQDLQPVIPFKLGSSWNLVTRTIVPFVHNERVAPDHQTGLGDITQSFFFVPAAGGPGGLVWGLGPVFVYPTGTDGLSAGKWGAGPTGILLQQSGHWTVGALANHVWSVAGRDDRSEVSRSLIQPFVAYTFPSTLSVTTQIEATYDWREEQWNAPIGVTVGKVFRVAGQAINPSVGARYYLDKPRGGPDWGIRFQLTLVFPE